MPKPIPAATRAANPAVLLSLDEFASRIGICRTAMRGLIDQRHIKTILIGRRRMVPATEVERLIARARADRPVQLALRAA